MDDPSGCCDFGRADAHDFMLNTPEGDSFSLYGVKSKLKLIDFWASYCGPCRVENAHVMALYHEFHSKGFEVISISSDTRVKDWMRAIAEDQLVWKYHGMFLPVKSRSLRCMVFLQFLVRF